MKFNESGSKLTETPRKDFSIDYSNWGFKFKTYMF